jgi:hypothetical protein
MSKISRDVPRVLGDMLGIIVIGRPLVLSLRQRTFTMITISTRTVVFGWPMGLQWKRMLLIGCLALWKRGQSEGDVVRYTKIPHGELVRHLRIPHLLGSLTDCSRTMSSNLFFIHSLAMEASQPPDQPKGICANP